MDSWRKTSLGEVIELKRGYDLPKRKRTLGNVPIVSSSGISDFHSEAKVSGPGVVTGRYGTIGEVYFVREDYWPLNTALYVRDFKGNDEKFIAYFLQTINWSSYSDKAAVPGVNRNHVHQAKVSIPPVAEQKKIAAVLGSLDDKIELNQQMNKTLEAMARAIFKSWFVDFDPVHANVAAVAAGRPLPHPDFPTAFTDSQLGPIPEGWEAVQLGSLIKERKEKNKDEEVNRVLSAVQTGELVLSSDHFNKRVHSKNLRGYKIVKRFDFAFNPSRINIGSIGLLKDYEIGVVSPVYTVFDVQDKYEWFLEQFIRLGTTGEMINQLSSGSVRQSLKFADLATLPIVVPPPEHVERFNKIQLTLRNGVLQNYVESQTLAELRDTLLPKLISGQLRLPVATV